VSIWFAVEIGLPVVLPRSKPTKLLNPLLLPPNNVSFPPPPIRMSFPASPNRRSFPSPPKTLSFPPPARIETFLVIPLRLILSRPSPEVISTVLMFGALSGKISAKSAKANLLSWSYKATCPLVLSLIFSILLRLERELL
jgi:hypothetical protein